MRLLAAYRWMHHRMPELFPDIEDAIAVSSAANQFISNSLKKKSVRRCRRCGQGLPDLHKLRHLRAVLRDALRAERLTRIQLSAGLMRKTISPFTGLAE